jgi:hypothetical protein
MDTNTSNWPGRDDAHAASLWPSGNGGACQIV